jgi:hypothetical protein
MKTHHCDALVSFLVVSAGVYIAFVLTDPYMQDHGSILMSITTNVADHITSMSRDMHREYCSLVVGSICLLSYDPLSGIFGCVIDGVTIDDLTRHLANNRPALDILSKIRSSLSDLEMRHTKSRLDMHSRSFLFASSMLEIENDIASAKSFYPYLRPVWDVLERRRRIVFLPVCR